MSVGNQSARLCMQAEHLKERLQGELRMTEKDIQQRIIEQSAKIAKMLSRNMDCELRKDATKGIKIIRVSKKEV